MRLSQTYYSSFLTYEENDVQLNENYEAIFSSIDKLKQLTLSFFILLLVKYFG